MPRAKITTPSGATIVIEGSTEEVAQLVGKIEGTHGGSESSRRASGDRKSQRTKETLSGHIMTLIDKGFFKEPKDLAAVRLRLGEMGHVYPLTTLSPAMLRRVRSRDLRRLKQGNRWFYTG